MGTTATAASGNLTTGDQRSELAAYVIIMGCGEYSDRYTAPARVYLDKAAAQACMTNLEQIYRHYREILKRETSYYACLELERKLSAEARAKYKELGFDAGIHDDWELAECALATSAGARITSGE